MATYRRANHFAETRCARTVFFRSRTTARSCTSFRKFSLAAVAGVSQDTNPKPKAQPRRSRSPTRWTTPPPSQKGKGKGKRNQGRQGRGPDVPRALSTTRICKPQRARDFAGDIYNLETGCIAATNQENVAIVEFIYVLNLAVKNLTVYKRTSDRMQWVPHLFSLVTPRGSESQLSKRHPLHQMFAIEIFAGSGRLTASLRAVGLQDSFGVDLSCLRPSEVP